MEYRTENYAANVLYVTRAKDEDGNISYEFKNKFGQVVLTRQINAGKSIDTNYIYDSFDNLRAVLPPEASARLLSATSTASWTETNENLKLYAYLYKYDDRNRCIWKKLPGCEPVFYIYDGADHLIFTQDGENRKAGIWQFSVPDAFGRTVLTGTCKVSYSYSDNPLGTTVIKGTYNTSRTNLADCYTISGISITNTSPAILTANFYDNYNFMGISEVPNNTNTQYNGESGYSTCYGDHQAANANKSKGLLTGTLTAQMYSNGTISSTYLYSVMYYDDRGRIVQTKSNNQLAGGLEKEYFAYDFTGKPTGKKHIHQATGKTTQTEVYVNSYDHAERLTKTTHQLNTGAVTTIAENTYDELGRLKTNKKGGLANANTTYAYNIRSWVKSISSPSFIETLYYNESYRSYAKAYNGNLSAMTWYVPVESSMLCGYNFTYNNLSWLTSATYSENEISKLGHSTNYVYDNQGNIIKLQRGGKTIVTAEGLVDNLTITYTGNQLLKAEDAVTNISIAGSMDFKDYSHTEKEYTYNDNGAMTKDLNKGISDIQYNLLNLPRQMVINSPTAKGKNYYTYSASGVKLKTEQRYDPNLLVSPVNTTTPTNDGLSDYKNTDYMGNIIYETVKSGSTTTNKTRILINGGYIEDGVYHYYLTDHLGNNRVVVNSSGTVIQKNHYYPFGMAFADTPIAEQGKQPYKFGGKELDQMHGLNQYDYSARYYDPAIARFTSQDPLAEKKPWQSPYCAMSNDPINRIDPDGRDDYYTNQGRFLYRDDKETDNIIIRTENYNKTMAETAKASGASWVDISKMPDFIDTPLMDLTLSAEAYSNIFTDVLSKMDGVDTKTLYNDAVSVRVMDTDVDYRDRNCFNDPSISRNHASAGEKDGKNHITATVRVGADRELYGTVSNVQNMLGDHEFKGHRVNGWGDATGTHYKVYEFQMKQPSWKKTTNYYKAMVLDNYNDYLNSKR